VSPHSRSAFRLGAAAFAAALPALFGAPGARAGEAPERFDVVAIDAGHGGEDHGAEAAGGMLEKGLVLDLARGLAARLRRDGLRVVLTREDDRFVPLETRTHLANDARADLFLSIHANAAPEPAVRGTETYFLSLDASDESARRVAARENQAFPEAGKGAGPAGDPLVALLGDLISTEHLAESQEFARLAQRELAGLAPEHSRGVKQAPFVVLMTVQMPASLVEVGVLTNRDDARRLAQAKTREAIVAALARAVHEFGQRFDARHVEASR
jgi:N-acetylmuramoyl-L-alanine amidase